jgi:hypothetical protein
MTMAQNDRRLEVKEENRSVGQHPNKRLGIAIRESRLLRMKANVNSIKRLLERKMRPERRQILQDELVRQMNAVDRCREEIDARKLEKSA